VAGSRSPGGRAMRARRSVTNTGPVRRPLSSPGSSRGGAGLPHDHVDRVAFAAAFGAAVAQIQLVDVEGEDLVGAGGGLISIRHRVRSRGPRSWRWRAPRAGLGGESGSSQTSRLGRGVGGWHHGCLPPAPLPRRSAEHHKRQNTTARREPATPAESGQLRPPRHCCIGGSRIRADVTPPTGHLHIGLIDLPAIHDSVPARPGGFGQQRVKRWTYRR
jgi:hypothetical protein